MARALLGTQDMGLAIALLCKGFHLVDLKQSDNTTRITFRFQWQDDLHETAQAYWNGALQVDAKHYWHESRTLKARLYSME